MFGAEAFERLGHDQVPNISLGRCVILNTKIYGGLPVAGNLCVSAWPIVNRQTEKILNNFMLTPQWNCVCVRG